MAKFAITGAARAAARRDFGDFRFGDYRYSIYTEGTNFVILDHRAGVKMTTNAVMPGYETKGSVSLYTSQDDFYRTDRFFGKLLHSYRLPGAHSGYQRFPLLDEKALLDAVEEYRTAHPKAWEEIASAANSERLEHALEDVRINRQVIGMVFVVFFAVATLFTYTFGLPESEQPKPETGISLFEVFFGGD